MCPIYSNLLCICVKVQISVEKRTDRFRTDLRTDKNLNEFTLIRTLLLRTVSKDSKNHWKKKYPYTEFSSDEIKSRLNHCDIITKRSEPWESVEDNILIWFFFRGKSKTFWIHPIQYVHLAVIDISPISTKMRLVFFFFFLFLVFSYLINNLTEDYKWSKLIVISPWKTFLSNCPDKFATGQKYSSIDVKLISYFFLHIE